MGSLQTKTFQWGKHTVTLEAGEIARQATAAVLVNMDDTVVLVTVVALKEVPEGIDYLPLSVYYQERTYASGRIPGGYFKREGRPTEKETLTSRLIDRPIRPLFPEGFSHEVQIIATVISINPQVDPDIPAMLGAGAALAISGLPFHGPVVGVRVGYQEGQFLLNPSSKEVLNSDLDLVVAGTQAGVLMVESQANELSEELMLEAILFGHQQMQTAIHAIQEFATAVSAPAWDWTPADPHEDLVNKLKELIEIPLVHAYQIHAKLERKQKIDEVRQLALEQLLAAGFEQPIIEQAFKNLEKEVVRGAILNGKPRIDGRDTRTIRPIAVKTGVLPRTHGSAIFTRGETQALVVVTLGTERDAQIVESLEGEVRESFMLHYNFPPYCVGEVGQVGSPKRREIGHGRLAWRAAQAVLPSEQEFPYVIRVVSEITESNGSSSMATVCGTSLALMDAAVPLRAPIAGIAMGLIKEGNRFAVLSDILGDEDHLGDMDFKVAGTAEGITALQMDIKTDSLTKEIMSAALSQAREGRLHILGIMNQALNQPRSMVSDYAPRIVTLQIQPEKIRDLIGKGGATIRQLTEETGTLIDISDDGVVRVATPDAAACKAALDRIKELTSDLEVGKVYEGTVAKITDFGAFVTVMPGRDGLVHISQISDARVDRVSDVLQEGQAVRVKVLEIDRMGRVRLTMKDLETIASLAE